MKQCRDHLFSQENSVKNYDVVIEMLSSVIQKPTLALIDSQQSDIKLVFQNVTLSAMRYFNFLRNLAIFKEKHSSSKIQCSNEGTKFMKYQRFS